MAEADRPDPPGEAARTAQGGLAVRLQLRRAQLVQAAQADRTKTCGKVRAELRLKTPQSLKRLFRGMQKARQHKIKLSLDQTST
jgi:hypothetical protein